MARDALRSRAMVDFAPGYGLCGSRPSAAQPRTQLSVATRPRSSKIKADHASKRR